MNQEDLNINIIFRLNDLVNQENYDEMDDLFITNYIDHNPSWDIQNLDDLKNTIAEAHKNFNIHNEIEEVIASEDKVFVRINSKGRHITKAFGVPPTDQVTSLLTFEIYRLENGKIAERWVISDLLNLMRQVGAELPL